MFCLKTSHSVINKPGTKTPTAQRTMNSIASNKIKTMMNMTQQMGLITSQQQRP